MKYFQTQLAMLYWLQSWKEITDYPRIDQWLEHLVNLEFVKSTYRSREMKPMQEKIYIHLWLWFSNVNKVLTQTLKSYTVL